MRIIPRFDAFKGEHTAFVRRDPETDLEGGLFEYHPSPSMGRRVRSGQTRGVCIDKFTSDRDARGVRDCYGIGETAGRSLYKACYEHAININYLMVSYFGPADTGLEARTLVGYAKARGIECETEQDVIDYLVNQIECSANAQHLEKSPDRLNRFLAARLEPDLTPSQERKRDAERAAEEKLYQQEVEAAAQRRSTKYHISPENARKLFRGGYPSLLDEDSLPCYGGGSSTGDISLAEILGGVNSSGSSPTDAEDFLKRLTAEYRRISKEKINKVITQPREEMYEGLYERMGQELDGIRRRTVITSPSGEVASYSPAMITEDGRTVPNPHYRPDQRRQFVVGEITRTENSVTLSVISAMKSIDFWAARGDLEGVALYKRKYIGVIGDYAGKVLAGLEGRITK